MAIRSNFLQRNEISCVAALNAMWAGGRYIYAMTSSSVPLFPGAQAVAAII